MVHLVAGLALLLSALFTGAALYITVVEHPARMSCGIDIAIREWSVSDRRAAPMQASLAIASAVTGIMTWFHGEGIAWLWGGLLILAVVPFTPLIIKPTNDQLLARGDGTSSLDTRRLLERWGRLHALPTALGLAASLVYVYGVMDL